MAVEYREPWYEIEDENHRAALQRQYDLEISKQHLLWGEEGFVIGKNGGTDEILWHLPNSALFPIPPKRRVHRQKKRRVQSGGNDVISYQVRSGEPALGWWLGRKKNAAAQHISSTTTAQPPGP